MEIEAENVRRESENKEKANGEFLERITGLEGGIQELEEKNLELGKRYEMAEQENKELKGENEGKIKELTE